MEEVPRKAGSHRQGPGVSSVQAGAGLSRVQAGGCRVGHKPKVSRILAGSGLDLGSFSRSGASWPKWGIRRGAEVGLMYHREVGPAPKNRLQLRGCSFQNPLLPYPAGARAGGGEKDATSSCLLSGASSNLKLQLL